MTVHRSRTPPPPPALPHQSGAIASHFLPLTYPNRAPLSSLRPAVAASAVSRLALASGRAAPGLSEAKLLLKYKMLPVMLETLPPPAVFPSRSSLVLAVQAAGTAACGDLELPTHAELASELAPHMRMSFSCVVDMEQPE